MGVCLPFETITFDHAQHALVILDQTKLPGEQVQRRLTAPEEVRDAIRVLAVRGAPAIGVAAAYGLYLVAYRLSGQEASDFWAGIHAAREMLAAARPTAVNLVWALDRVLGAAQQADPPAIAAASMLREADAIWEEDIRVCARIGEYGAALLSDGDGVLTHCNAGQLAATRLGTALAPIYTAHSQGKRLRVFADETRPLLQGARLTAFELMAAGVDTTLICDNMASQVMKNGWVQAVLVGADRVAANGDCCNKIGTSGVAVLANYYGIPFYVCAPTATIDLACASGADIPIEQRAAEEVTELWYETRMAPAGVQVYNPAFDCAEHGLVSGIVTEFGIARPPYAASLAEMMRIKEETNG